MIRCFLLTFLVICSQFGRANSSLLERVITIDIKSTPVKRILVAIEEKAKVKFSYDPDLVDESKIVSLSIKEKTIEYGLSLIFDGTIRFKEVGNHIVLLQTESKLDIKERKKGHATFEFSGVIRDIRTGEPIEGASVYDVESRLAVISDDKGNYSLSIPKEELVRSLYFKKVGYEAKVIVVSADKAENLKNNISLIPINSEVKKLEVSEMIRVGVPIEHRAISGALVSEDTYIHSENLNDINEIRVAQISLVPSVGIGSNLSTNGLITNRISLNILAGYSQGVKGAEVGGLLNMCKGNVEGFQAAGISNLVGGDIRGAQFAGIANLSQGDFLGFQASGISSIVKGDFHGAQVSGISSIVRGGFDGFQVSGISSVAFRSSNGIQISGISNTVFDTLNGTQIAGISNLAIHGTNRVQLAGISNWADQNEGVQVSGIVNYANFNGGFQLSLVNLSKKSNGISLGLFNYVKEGYHKTELSANEVFHANLMFKTGVKRLYNSYHIGVKFGPKSAYAAGLGLGTYFDLGEKSRISLDLTSDIVFENDFAKFEFAQLYKFSSTFDYQLAKWVTIFGGPSINMNVMAFKNDEGVFTSDLAFHPFVEKTFASSLLQAWIGFQVGFRF